MKLLLITEKYFEHDKPEFGLTNNMYNLAGSFQCSGLGELEHHFISPHGDLWSTEAVDRVLTTSTYDLAVISVYYHLPSWGVACQLGQKLCLCWWDAEKSLGAVRHWAGTCHQLIFDHGQGEQYPNVFVVPVPQDTRIFCRKDVTEDIDVSFIGSITPYWGDRIATVQRIRDAGINLYVGGGRGTGLGNMSVEDYAAIHQRSKICLNLAVGHGRPQRKGRIYEIAACGKCMLSNHPETMHGWFEEGNDYASFTDDSVVERIRYYLNHPEERQRLAENMYQKHADNYTPKHFWQRVSQICGIS